MQTKRGADFSASFFEIGRQVSQVSRFIYGKKPECPGLWLEMNGK